jgi:uncharacterized coiled-coil protein SlyX
MKTKIWFLAMTLVVAFSWSCRQGEVENLKGENSKLLTETLKKDSTINMLFQAFNEIEENLEVIKAKQNVISADAKGNPEMGQNIRDRINDDITSINDLMDKNKRTIASLRKKLKAANLRMDEFERVIERLNKKVEEKDVEITGLKDQLVKMNFKVEELNARVDSVRTESAKKSEVIESKTTELNTAWYAYGTSKELIGKGILEKSGGFLGIGKNKKLTSEIDKSYLTKVDITKLKEIPLNSKSAVLKTNHPGSSYTLVKEGKIISKLEINDPAKFWEASKYLIIVVE